MSLGKRDADHESVTPTAAVVGVAGTSLSVCERELFQQTKPAGFILFARNCDSPDQVTALVRDLRAAIDDPDAPVLIDQEGGRVARLKPPHWHAMPSLRAIGRRAIRDLDAAKEAAWLHARLTAADLWPLGITVNCAPVLDLGLAGQTEAIGDRAFSEDADIVAALGRSTIDGYLAGGVLPVIKHLPGHGRAKVDSHASLPCVDAEQNVLANNDWLPFRVNADAPFGMTAHILFTALDRTACTTHSASIVHDVIRGKIGFDGALFSDDLSMNALGGSLGDRARRARRAGCDLALHCNGDIDEMAAVLGASGPLEGESRARFKRAMARRQAPEPIDLEVAKHRLDELLSDRSECFEAAV